MPKRLGLFENNKFIKTVIVPHSIQYIERETFMESTVERVTIEGNINELCQATFSGCANLEEVVSGEVEVFDWGSSAVRTIITLDRPVTKESVEAAAFTVKETKEAFDMAQSTYEEVYQAEFDVFP